MTRGAARILFVEAVFLCLCLVACGAADIPRPAKGETLVERGRQENLLREKARLFLEKAQKAERTGEYADAVEAYEDAYEAFPGNVMPLLAWGELLCRLGQYSHSRAVLKRIPLKQLPPAGQARVNHLFAKIAIAAGEMDQAAISFGEVLKVQPENSGARIRLALVHDSFGHELRKIELIRDLQGRESLSYRDRTILFVLELGCLNLVEAFRDAAQLSNELALGEKSGDERISWSVGIQRYSFINFVSALPIGLSGVFGFAYALLMIGILTGIATRLAPVASLWGSIAFVTIAGAHILVAWWAGMPDARIAMLTDEFSIYDSVWILPRILIAMHIITISLFIVFPLFYLLPANMRPKRNELYAIWFFCWWFMMFVLLFQSRLNLTVRLPGITISAFCVCLAAIWMPLGKYLMFQCAKVTGLSRMMPAISTGDDGVESFSDAKLHEARSVSRLEAEDFTAVIVMGKKLFAMHDRAAFPEMHLAMIRASIELEDTYEAQKLLSEFHDQFGSSRHDPYGTLLEALLKNLTGDYAGALKAINSIPETRAALFGGDETALSLLVTGRCNVFFSQPQQAHLDWTRALEHARLPLVRASILVELALLDSADNRRDWTERWSAAADSLGGGTKTSAYVKLIRSIALFMADRADDAMQAAQEACALFAHCGPAFAWRGHLLCLKGRYAEAQALLETMAAGTAAGRRLMEEITTRF